MTRWPAGPAPLVLAALLVLSSVGLILYPSRGRSDVRDQDVTLHVWTFASTHYDAYRAVAPSFEAAHPGVKVDIEQVGYVALLSRLQAAFWADLETPDLVELEISSVGQFFRGPLDQVGLVDLTDRVRRAGLLDDLVYARLTPWMSRGRIFGLPHDVAPVMLAYRRDIFEQEGIDPASLDTWDKFVAAGHTITRDLDGDGVPDRFMIELSRVGCGFLEPLLYQRDGGIFDVDGQLIMDNDVAVDTMAWYVPLVAGPNRIASAMGDGQVLTQAVENGYVVCMLSPDWRSRSIEVTIPRMAGKMALMPLPMAKPDGRRTSTWGGTMIGIPKHARNHDLSWELAMHLYYTPEPFSRGFPNTYIIPALRTLWNVPAIRQTQSFWGGQSVGGLASSLADQAPPQYTSPYSPIAKAKLSEALVDCVTHYEQYGDAGFEAFVRSTLHAKADEVRRIMRRNPFQ